jgi:hypothetical protein
MVSDLSTQVQLFLAVMAGWMNRRQQQVIEYLLEENRILKEQFDRTGRKLRLSNHQRRNLAKRGLVLGWRQLRRYGSIATPETIYAWHRRLVALKYTAARKIITERQQRMAIIRELCMKIAEENPTWGYGRIQGALANVGYVVSDTILTVELSPTCKPIHLRPPPHPRNPPSREFPNTARDEQPLFQIRTPAPLAG